MVNSGRDKPWKCDVGVSSDDGRTLPWMRVAPTCHLLNDEDGFISVWVDADSRCFVDFESSRGGRVG